MASGKELGLCVVQDAEELTDAYVDLLTRMRPLIGQGLSAAVYTQTTDVEIEVNGLMTYDREVNKVDVDRAAEAARKLYLPPPKVQTLVPTSERQPQTWKYTCRQPADDWFQPDFADERLGDRPGWLRHAGNSRSDGRHEVGHAGHLDSPHVHVGRRCQPRDRSV